MGKVKEVTIVAVGVLIGLVALGVPTTFAVWLSLCAMGFRLTIWQIVGGEALYTIALWWGLSFADLMRAKK